MTLSPNIIQPYSITSMLKRITLFLCFSIAVAGLCEYLLTRMNFGPRYELRVAGLDPARSTLEFILDSEILYRLVPDPKRGINRQGFRDTEHPTVDWPDSNCKILAVGDSMIMGMAVAATDTAPKQLEQLLGSDCKVRNFGIQGYGPDQALIVAQEMAALLKPDKLILALFPSNDFHDLKKNSLYQLDQDEQLTRTVKNPISEILPSLRLQYFWHFVRHKRFFDQAVEENLHKLFFHDSGFNLADLSAEERKQSVALMKAIVRQFVKLSEKHEIELIVVVIPAMEYLDVPESQLATTNEHILVEAISGEVPALLNLGPVFRARNGDAEYAGRLYDPADLHLSATGHKLVAESLNNFIWKKGVPNQTPQ